jgi:hypothetical protein
MLAVYDDADYQLRLEDANTHYRPYLQVDQMLGLYYPVLYPSDFWILKKEYILVNTTDEVNITLRAGTISKDYFGYQK